MKYPLSPQASRPGSVLLEAVVALGILTFLVTALSQLTLGFWGDAHRAKVQTTATLMAQEGLEGMRSVADRDYRSITLGDHGITVENGVFTLSGTTTLSGSFARTITVAPVYRDGVGQIVQEGGTADGDASTVTSTVRWDAGGGNPFVVALTTILTDWMHAAWVIDLFDEFLPGSRHAVDILSVQNGAVQAQTRGDLLNPGVMRTVAIPFASAVTDLHIDKATDRLYLAMNGFGPRFHSYDISNIDVEGPLLRQSVDPGADCTRFALGEQVAYVLTTDTSKDIRIIRLSDFSVLSTVNLPTQALATDIIVDEAAQRLYAVTKSNTYGPEFFVLDLSTAPMSVIASSEIGANVQSFSISHGHAYLGTDRKNREIVLIDLAKTSEIVHCNLPQKDSVDRVMVVGNDLYIGRSDSTKPEFLNYALEDFSTMNCSILNHLRGRVEPEGNILAMDVDDSIRKAFLSVSSLTSSRLMVVDLDSFVTASTNFTGRLPCDSLLFLGKYAYAGCRGGSFPLQVLSGGTDGPFASPYSHWGTYTSPAFDSLSESTQWDTLSWQAGGGGSLSFRVRAADTAEHLENALWSGPDGTPSTAYTATGSVIALEPTSTGKRWIQWKAYLAGDGLVTPLLRSVSLTYR